MKEEVFWKLVVLFPSIWNWISFESVGIIMVQNIWVCSSGIWKKYSQICILKKKYAKVKQVCSALKFQVCVSFLTVSFFPYFFSMFHFIRDFVSILYVSLLRIFFSRSILKYSFFMLHPKIFNLSCVFPYSNILNHDYSHRFIWTKVATTIW